MNQIDDGEHGTSQSPLPRGGERRRHARRSGLWAAQIETAERGRHNCLLLDMSLGGAKLRIEQPLVLGEAVTLIADRFGTQRGRVVWTGDHRAGIVFLDKLGEAATTAQAATTDPKFLRGRAEVLRRLARSARGGAAGTGLLRLAQALEAEAAEIEKRRD